MNTILKYRWGFNTEHDVFFSWSIAASSGDDSSENTVELQKRYEKAKQQVSKLHSHLWKLDASHKKASATQQQTIADLEGKYK